MSGRFLAIGSQKRGQHESQEAAYRQRLNKVCPCKIGTHLQLLPDSALQSWHKGAGPVNPVAPQARIPAWRTSATAL
ncbi:hypothetical protein PTKU46_80570 [Paraburkholderia terrae]